MDFVQQQLIHHERKLKTRESKPEAPYDSALVGAQKRQPPKCWACDEVGHIQRFCPKRKEKSTSMHRAKITTEDEVESDSDVERAFSAYEEVSGDQWLIDSGASSHNMTPKREYFAKYRLFSTPEEVSLVMVGLLRQWVQCDVQCVACSKVGLQFIFRKSSGEKREHNQVWSIAVLDQRTERNS